MLLDGANFATWSSYDPSGRPQTLTYGNGVATSYGYDTMGHLTTLATRRGSNPALQDLTYDWYGRPNSGGLNIGSITDNRAAKTCADGSNADETQVYSYDALYRLSQADGIWGTKAFVYSAIGNPTTFGGRTLNFAGQQLVSGTGLAWILPPPTSRGRANS